MKTLAMRDLSRRAVSVLEALERGETFELRRNGKAGGYLTQIPPPLDQLPGFFQPGMSRSAALANLKQRRQEWPGGKECSGILMGALRRDGRRLTGYGQDHRWGLIVRESARWATVLRPTRCTIPNAASLAGLADGFSTLIRLSGSMSGCRALARGLLARLRRQRLL